MLIVTPGNRNYVKMEREWHIALYYDNVKLFYENDEESMKMDNPGCFYSRKQYCR